MLVSDLKKRTANPGRNVLNGDYTEEIAKDNKKTFLGKVFLDLFNEHGLTKPP
jgi:hypothetical protein